jgi:hypothetical protein
MQALEGGAYALPVGLPTEVYSVGGPTTQFDENTIETTVVCFKASEMAWHTLANCVAASALGGSVSRVLVD